MCADFYYYLNRQGLQGRDGARGEKGEPGNTPTFRTGVNTPTVYTLIVDSGDGVTFETGNLKYPMRDDGGDYLRYDRDDATVVLGNPNYADLQGNVGEVKLASVEDHEGGTAEGTDAVSYELFESNNEDLDNRMDGIDGEIERVDGRVTREIQDRDDADTALSDRIYLLDTNKANKTDVYTKTQTDNLLAGKANTQHTHTLSQITNAGTFAAKNTLDYNSSELTNKPVLGNLASKNTVDYQTEVTNKPTIPTVGDGTITITQGGVTKGTFTTNQSGNSTIELDAGGGGGTTYTEGPGITIDQDNEISVNVDNDTIVIEGNSLKANIPDVSNFVTDTQLANTLEAYPTNTALSNLVDYVTETSQTRRYIPLTAAQVTSENPMIGGPEVTVDTVDTGASYEITVKPKYTGSGYSFYSFGLGFKYLQDPTKFVALKGSELNIVSLPIVGSHTLTWRIYGISESLGYIIATQSSATAGIYFDNNTGRFVIPNDVYVINISVTLQVDPSETFNTTDTLLYCVARYNSEEGYSYLVDESTVTITKAVVADTAVDGTTIDVDNNGQLTYIGTTGDTLPSQAGNSGKFLTTDGSVTSWATVNQPDMSGYYTKTQTDSLLNGKISNNVVQNPLQYLPDTTGGLDLHNISSSTLTDTRVNGNFIYSYPYLLLRIFDASDNTYKNLYDNKDLINQNTISFCEINLINGLNFSGTYLYSNNSLYVYVLGKYNNSTFIPLGYLTSTDVGCKLYIYKESDIGYYDLGAVPIYTYTNVSISLYKPGSSNTGYISYQWSTGGDIKTCTFTQEESSTLNECTHVRMMAVASVNETGASTINLNTARFVNPDPTTFIVTDGTYADRSDTFQNSDNLFDAHPESLSLKYDSNTLGVNANNELYAISSTPSNMVTTDTNQTITGQKTFTNGIVLNGYNSMVLYQGSTNVYMQLHDLYNSSVGWRNGSQYAKMQYYNGNLIIQNSNTSDPKVYRLTTDNVYPTITSASNFLLEKDMLDGTTIQYNTSTNKVEVIGGGGGSSYTLPTASTSTLGGVKIDGTTITIDGNGVISSAGGSGSADIDNKTIVENDSNKLEARAVNLTYGDYTAADINPDATIVSGAPTVDYTPETYYVDLTNSEISMQKVTQYSNAQISFNFNMRGLPVAANQEFASISDGTNTYSIGTDNDGYVTVGGITSSYQMSTTTEAVYMQIRFNLLNDTITDISVNSGNFITANLPFASGASSTYSFNLKNAKYYYSAVNFYNDNSIYPIQEVRRPYKKVISDLNIMHFSVGNHYPDDGMSTLLLNYNNIVQPCENAKAWSTSGFPFNDTSTISRNGFDLEAKAVSFKTQTVGFTLADTCNITVDSSGLLTTSTTPGCTYTINDITSGQPYGAFLTLDIPTANLPRYTRVEFMNLRKESDNQAIMGKVYLFKTSESAVMVSATDPNGDSAADYTYDVNSGKIRVYLQIMSSNIRLCYRDGNRTYEWTRKSYDWDIYSFDLLTDSSVKLANVTIGAGSDWPNYEWSAYNVVDTGVTEISTLVKNIDNNTLTIDSDGILSASGGTIPDDITIKSDTNNVISATGLDLGKGLSNICTLVGDASYNKGNDTLTLTTSQGIANGLEIEYGYSSSRTTVTFDIKPETSAATGEVITILGTNGYYVSLDSSGLVKLCQNGNVTTHQSIVFNSPNSEGVHRIQIDYYPGNMQIYFKYWDWTNNTWASSTTLGLSQITEWYNNKLILGNTQGISNNCVTGIFYLNNLDLSIRNSSTDVVSTVDITTGALITGIDTTYLAVDAQGRLTLSAAVIAKLNSIT